jgi:glycosyltransferase involved in cell wall biosynthesis
MSAVWEENRPRARTLEGATVLQIVPALVEEPETRAALGTARILQQAGARAIIAGESGPLLDAVTAAGAEWLPLANASVNPLKLRRNVQALERFAILERVDILHAFGAGAAWSARAVAARLPLWIVTSLPDAPPLRRSPVHQFFDSALAAGDRVIASSAYAARPWIDRHSIRGDRIAIIPHAVDTAVFAPSRVSAERIAAVRRTWAVQPTDRVVLVPGQVSPANAQLILVDVARALVNGGTRNLVFVLAGQKAKSPGYVEELAKRARARGVDALFRTVGVPRDLPAVLAASHAVVVPAREPPHLGRIVAQAQAMARPVIASDIGVLAENLLAPPRMTEALRTGWLVRPESTASLGRAVHQALTLDRMSYQAMAARARQFAEFMFSPESVGDAVRSVYSSLLARDR